MSAMLSVEAIEQIPIFAGLTNEEAAEVQQAAETCSFAPGETVIEHGGSSQDLWILLEGKCDVVRTGMPGNGHNGGDVRPVVLATLQPFSNFGEMSFFHAAPHSAHVRAQTAVRLLRLTRAQHDVLAQRHPAICAKLAVNTVASLADRIRRLDDWVADLVTQKSLAEKVPELVRLQKQLFDGWKL